MITYNSGMAKNAPVSASLMKEATRDYVQSPWSYPSNHADIIRARGKSNLAQLWRAADAANTDYDLRHQQSQDALALSGLQQMASAQQQQRRLETDRAGAAMSAYSGLLSGLFG